jgi:arginyl-tRNA synthetase
LPCSRPPWRPIVAGTDLTPNVVLERPRDPSHGDIACNIAMQLAKPLKTNPRELATRLVAALLADPKAPGPGRIGRRRRSRLHQPARGRQAPSSRWCAASWSRAQAFGRGNGGEGHHAIIEFVSANPTGPLHVGHGRQAALGDACPRCSSRRATKVTREFYYNDAGVQIATLANSVQARARGFKPGDAEWPESAYNGDYIADIADDFLAGRPCRPATASRPPPAATRRHRIDPPLRRDLPAQRAGPGPAGLRRQVRQLLPRVVAVRRRQGRCRPCRRWSTPASPTSRTARCG